MQPTARTKASRAAADARRYAVYLRTTTANERAEDAIRGDVAMSRYTLIVALLLLADAGIWAAQQRPDFSGERILNRQQAL